jgi:acyl-coenzyme A thioesterase PaaI-like protein
LTRQGTIATDTPEKHLTEAEVRSFISALPFIQEFAIRLTSVVPGQVTIELPFETRFSGPPGHFPASMVGVAGDVAAVASCLSVLPSGWALATLDFTIKMTNAARGDKLIARGRVLQAGRTNSIGAADVYSVAADREILCGTVLATTRNFPLARDGSSTSP